TVGSPITLVVENRDWRNWTGKMSPLAADRDPKYVVTRPRPGHADLTGALKYDRRAREVPAPAARRRGARLGERDRQHPRPPRGPLVRRDLRGRGEERGPARRS